MATPKRMRLSTSIQASFGRPDDPDYVFDVVTNVDNSAMAVSLSTHAIKLYSPFTGQFVSNLLGHSNTISGLGFPDPASPHLLFSSSADGSVRSWDIRDGKEIKALRGPNTTAEIWSFDLGGSSGSLITGGGNAEVLFWDWRTRKMVACLEECHTEPVTQVKFHPTKRDTLLTASVDGLMNFIDTKGKILDDDSLGHVINAGTSISKVGFFGRELEQIWSLTHIESLSLWSFHEQSLMRDFGHSTRGAASVHWQLPAVDYLIGCHYVSAADSLWLVAGNNDGGVGYFPVMHTTAENACIGGPVGAILEGGHMGVVRTVCSPESKQSENLLFCWTGGEDGRLCSWSENGSLDRGQAWVSSGLVSRRTNTKHRHSPY